MTDKPDLTRVWALGAPSGNIIDPDLTTPGKFAAGWQAEVPPFEYFNFIQKQITEGLAHINEQGIAVWDNVTTYPVGALAKGSDGNVYKSLASQSDNDPVSDGGINWDKELTKADLISEVAGKGAGLVSMEGGPSVEVAVLHRVIQVATVADLPVSSTEGFQSLVAGVSFTYTSSDWEPTLRMVTPECFGANGNNTGDDYQAVQDAADYCILKDCALTGWGDYQVDQPPDLRSIPVLMSSARFLATNDGLAVILGGDSGNGYNPPQNIGVAINTSTTPTLTVKAQIRGAKHQLISIGRCDYLQLYADTDSVTGGADDTSIAYNDITLNRGFILELTNNLSTDGSSIQWINENVFHLGKVRDIIITGTYSHNHNTFWGGVFESAGLINMEVGYSNQIKSARCEGAETDLVFGSDTWYCSVEVTWASNPRIPIEPTAFGFATVTDNGTQNRVINAWSKDKHYLDLITVTPYNAQGFDAAFAKAQVATSVQGAAIQPGGFDYFTRQSGQIVADLPLFPVVVNQAIYFVANEPEYRATLEIFDVNKEKIDLSEAAMEELIDRGTSLDYNGTLKGWQGFTNSQNIYFSITDSSVKFVLFKVSTGSVVTGKPLTGFTLSTSNMIYPLFSLSRTNAFGGDKIPSVDAIPTIGFAYAGQKVSNIAGGWFTCTDREDNSLAVAASTTDTVITLGSTGATAGDIIAVELDDLSTHWTAVNSVATNDVTLDDAMPSDAQLGRRVAIMRWTNS
jgi:hypothetical protein